VRWHVALVFFPFLLAYGSPVPFTVSFVDALPFPGKAKVLFFPLSLVPFFCYRRFVLLSVYAG
jgi:hypothetical protein